MKKILFDTSAIICYTAMEKGYEKAVELFKEVESGYALGFISAVSLTEVINKLGKENEARALEMTSFIEEKIRIIPSDKETCINAGLIKIRHRELSLSTADSIIIATAIGLGADVVAGTDSEWEKVPEIKFTHLRK